MKKTFVFLLSTSLLMVGALNAQTTVGLKMGTTVSMMDGLSNHYTTDFETRSSGVSIAGQTDPPVNEFVFSERNAFAGGVYVNVPLSNRVSIQPEILFNGKGFVLDYGIQRDLNIYDVTNIYRFNYLETPIMFRINSKLGHLRPYMLLGGAPSFLVSSRVLHRENSLVANATDFETSLNASGFDTEGNDIDFINLSKSFDFSVIGGLGFDYNLTELVSFKMEGRYQYGFHDVFNPGVVGTYESQIKSFTLFIGVGFNLSSANVCLPPSMEDVEMEEEAIEE